MAFLLPALGKIGALATSKAFYAGVGKSAVTALTSEAGMSAAMMAGGQLMNKRAQDKMLKGQNYKPTNLPDSDELQRAAMRSVASRKGSRTKTVLTSQEEGSLGG